MCVVAASANCDRDGVTLDYYHVLHSKQVGFFFFLIYQIEMWGIIKIISSEERNKLVKRKRWREKRKCWRSLRAFLDRHVSFFSKKRRNFFL